MATPPRDMPSRYRDLSSARFIRPTRCVYAGATPDDFAAAQATAWKDGLAGWGYGPEQVGKLRNACDFTIYTPGSEAGAAINIVGSLQVPDTDDAETISDEVDGYVSGLLGTWSTSAAPSPA